MRITRQGILIVAGAALGIVAELANAFWPEQSALDRVSYPFTPEGRVTVSILTVVAELLIVAGLVALFLRDRQPASRLYGIARWGLPLALAVNAAGELVEASLAWSPTAEGEAVLPLIFGPGSLLLGLSAVLAGIGLLRGRAWGAVGSWSILATGLVLFLVVLPAQFAPIPHRFANLALALLFLAVLWIGLAARVPKADGAVSP